MINKIITRLLEVIPFAIVFIVTFRYPFTPDFGWHLKNGEFLIREGRIIDTNFYSTLMDGFKYTNISWLLDGITYLVFSNFSFIGIGFLSALVFTLIYLIFSIIGKLDFWQKMIVFPIILFLGDVFTRNSFQSQSISILFLALIIYLLTLFKKHERLASVLILLIMILWAQIHAQFVIGLVIIGVWIGSCFIEDYVKDKKFSLKNYIKLFLIFLGSFLVTLINPYGLSIYREIFAHFGYSQTLRGVSEWASPLEESITTVTYLGVITVFIIGVCYLVYKKKFMKNLFLVLFPLLFVIQSTFQIRYLFTALFLIIPIFGIMINDLRPKEIKLQKYIALITLGSFYILALYWFPVNSFLRNNWDYSCVHLGCSDSAAKFILENNLQENLYTEYSFGGWLIWNYYPEIKPVIDGRMHVWNDNGYSGFEDYARYMENTESIDKSRYDTAYVLNKDPIYFELLNLVEEEKWQVVYRDPLSSIFIRN